jgi:hypothetical protein
VVIGGGSFLAAEHVTDLRKIKAPAFGLLQLDDIEHVFSMRAEPGLMGDRR